MSGILVLAIFAFLPVASTVVWATRKAASEPEYPGKNWLDDFSTDRYEPLFRVLGAEDIEFLKSQPEFTPKMLSRFRRERCRIAFGYLRMLSRDFHNVTRALQALMLNSEVDRPDLGRTLLQSEVMFTYGIAIILGRLLLFSLGIGRVEFGGVVALFNSMRMELGTLVPSAVPAGA